MAENVTINNILFIHCRELSCFEYMYVSVINKITKKSTLSRGHLAFQSRNLIIIKRWSRGFSSRTGLEFQPRHVGKLPVTAG